MLVDSYFDRWIVAANHHFKDKELGLFGSKGTPLNEKYFTLTSLAKEKKARIKSIEFDALINEEVKLKMFNERVTHDIEKFYVSYAETDCEGFYIHQTVVQLKKKQSEGFLNTINAIASEDVGQLDEDELMNQLQSHFIPQQSLDYSNEDGIGKPAAGASGGSPLDSKGSSSLEIDGTNMRIQLLKEVFVALAKKKKKNKVINPAPAAGLQKKQSFLRKLSLRKNSNSRKIDKQEE